MPGSPSGDLSGSVFTAVKTERAAIDRALRYAHHLRVQAIRGQVTVTL